jgi:transposase
LFGKTKLQKLLIKNKTIMQQQSSPSLYCGIDISGDTIDVCIQQSNQNFIWEKLPNTKEGFQSLLSLCGKGYHFVMESTGVYHLPLCFYLHEKKCAYSVINALQIKRYIQMHLERNKSDKKDARHICQYGIDRNPDCYEMPDRLYFECKSLNNGIESITSEMTSFKNKLYSLQKLSPVNKILVKSYKDAIKFFQLELKKIEKELYQKLEQWQPELVKQVSSVIGIGKRATAILIVNTQGFKFTETYQQLISYAGLSPKEYSSGSSIRGRVRICKQGGDHLRHTLYMGALNAKANNPQCKQLFDRLVAKGKNKKLAVIAVCNKLLKQVFGVVKSGKLYDKNYLQKTA